MGIILTDDHFADFCSTARETHSLDSQIDLATVHVLEDFEENMKNAKAPPFCLVIRAPEIIDHNCMLV